MGHFKRINFGSIRRENTRIFLKSEFLFNLFPPLPPVSSYFKSAVEACRPFAEDMLNRANYPIPPDYHSLEELYTWQYVSSAAKH